PRHRQAVPVRRHAHARGPPRRPRGGGRRARSPHRRGPRHRPEGTMSTRLDLALQELAEAAGATSGFGDPDTSDTVQTVSRLAARVRRRRAVRTARTTAVAASAAGAVALVAPQLTREVTPAGDPDAAPGTCGSAVTRIPSGPKDVLSIE